MARVIYSAGHSPVDKGAVIGDLVEYDLTNRIVDELEPLLAKYTKLKPIRIPTGLSLPQKIAWINNTGYTGDENDIAVEVHINDADGTEEGVECWQAERGENASWHLCNSILDAICEETGMKKRGVNSEYDHQFRRLGYVHNTITISGLFEIGFMDHPKDKKILTSDEGVKKIAKGTLRGILAYYGLEEGEFDKEPIAKPKYPVHTQPDEYSKPFGMMPQNAAPVTGTASPSAASPYGQFRTPQLSNAIRNATGSAGSTAMPSGYPSAPTPAASAPTSTPTSYYPSTASVQSPAEKMEMVQRLYQKILGRNPDQAGLAYYASSQMTEQALMKLMIESKEHQNLVKAAKDYVKMEEEFENSKRQLESLKSAMDDKDTEIQTMSAYLQEKSKEIVQLKEKIQKLKTFGQEQQGENSNNKNGRDKNGKKKPFGAFNVLRRSK